MVVKVFVSYSHRNTDRAKELLGFLKALEQDGVEVWWDERIAAGDLWDETIRSRIAGSQIALVLVSQHFLASSNCTDVEVSSFLERELKILPVILAPCEWKRHEWLSSRQFLPGGCKTIAEHYRDMGKRERLFLKILTELRKMVEEVRAAMPAAATDNPFGQTMAIRDPAAFIGRETELARLRTLLGGGSVALAGEPKIGKSSLLWRLAATWDGDVVGPISFHGMEDLDDFYATLEDELDVKVTRWPDLRKVLWRRELLLLLDELDGAPACGFGIESLAGFRAACDKNRGLRMVVAGRHHAKTIFPDDSSKGSPAYNFLQPLTIGPMPEDEARTILGHPWAPSSETLDNRSVEMIVERAKGHPFKAQRGGFHRYEALSGCHDWEADWHHDLEKML